MDLNTFLKDPRRRNLAILAAAALVCVLLAVLALGVQDSDVAPRNTPESFFPGLFERAHKDDIARIRIQTGTRAFDVVFKPYVGWVLPSRNDYRASPDIVQQTLFGMGSLETIQPKTARSDWLRYLNLDAPPKGRGTLITLMDDKGNVVAAMIVGKSIDIGDATGRLGIFMRKPDTAQSWLVSSAVEFKNDPSDWMDKHVMSVDRARIQETDIDPVGAASYEARRESPGNPDFAVNDLPGGRELADPTAADGVAAAISNFTIADARPAKDFDFGDAARHITKTFDGLTVTVETLKQADGYWATVSADSAPGKPDAAGEAREINAHANGWAYRLPDAEGQLFMTTLDSLLKPVGAAKAAPKP